MNKKIKTQPFVFITLSSSILSLRHHPEHILEVFFPKHSRGGFEVFRLMVFHEFEKVSADDKKTWFGKKGCSSILFFSPRVEIS